MRLCFNMAGISQWSKLALVRRRPCSVMLCFYRTKKLFTLSRMQNTTGKEGNSDHVCKEILLIFIDKVKPMYLQLGVTFAYEGIKLSVDNQIGSWRWKPLIFCIFTITQEIEDSLGHVILHKLRFPDEAPYWNAILVGRNSRKNIICVYSWFERILPFAERPLRHITDCMTDLFAEESA